MKVNEPMTREDFEKYYRLRWQVLRKPWEQPKGSERDELDATSTHAFLKNKLGEVIAIGRLHFNSETEGQIRFMAVSEKYRGNNYGVGILKYLEEKAKANGAEKIILEARSTAVSFYKRNGYELLKKSFVLFDAIQHYRMQKLLK
ncbi:MAG: GNAT family N-acetyltransferase [Bacteroidia bacterium]